MHCIGCRLAVCDTDQKEITIDETYCWSVDHLGRPIDIYSEADYRMQVSQGCSEIKGLIIRAVMTEFISNEEKRFKTIHILI